MKTTLRIFLHLGIGFLFASSVPLAYAVPVINIQNGANNTADYTFRFDDKAFRDENKYLQSLGLDFSDDLSSTQDILSGAILEINGANIVGNTELGSNNVLTQGTQGTSFSLWGDENQTDLLLGGTIGSGFLSAVNESKNNILFERLGAWDNERNFSLCVSQEEWPN